jgi:hypothetical protein
VFHGTFTEGFRQGVRVFVLGKTDSEIFPKNFGLNPWRNFDKIAV